MTRTCVGCRTKGPPAGMLRVVSVQGRLVADPGRRLPGRGAWVHPACIAEASRRRAWARALRATGPLDVSGLDSPAV
jgi:predicted RNA-binding protein YlxR (DUF448 family)